MDKLNIALIGCGPRGVRGHGQKLKDSDYFDLVAVCDLDESLAASTAETLGCEAVTDYKRLLRRKTIDAVAIVTATEHHFDIALRAAKAGKHLLVEKPLTHDFASAVQLYNTSVETGVTGMVCYQLRFHPLYEAMKKQAVKVQPVQIYTSRQCGVMGEKYLNAKAQSGLMDFCSHDFDVAVWLMGLPPKRLYANVGRGIYTETEAVDMLSVHLGFGGDPPRVANVLSSMGGMGLPRRYDIVGRHGNFTQKGQGLKCTMLTVGEDGRSSAESEDIEVRSDVGDPTDLLHAHFAKSILDETGKLPCKATLRDGVNSLLIAEAALESSRTKSVIELGEFAAAYDYEIA